MNNFYIVEKAITQLSCKFYANCNNYTCSVSRYPISSSRQFAIIFAAWIEKILALPGLIFHRY